MTPVYGFSAAARLLITFAAFVIVVAGLKAAETLMVTFLLSAFFAILCAPPFLFLQSRGVPAALALVIMILVILLADLALISIVANTVTSFTQDLPLYQQRMQALVQQFFDQLNVWGIHIPANFVSQYLDPSVGFKMAAGALGSLGNTLSSGFLIILTVIFMLFEAASFPHKLQAAFGHNRHLLAVQNFLDTVKRYTVIKSVASLATGLLVYVWLLILGVDYALLWGLAAFLLNFIPNIGSIIAAVPAVLLALIQLGPLYALLTVAGYLFANLLIGNVIEPRYMGRGLGLSTLVVFLSLVFWGWVLGPVGMLLSVPLTMLLKIAFETNDDTRWLSVLLGPDVPTTALPPATVVQESMQQSTQERDPR